MRCPLGCPLPGTLDRTEMDSERKNPTHKHPRNECSTISHPDFHQTEKVYINTAKGRQLHNIVIPSKNGGNEKHNPHQITWDYLISKKISLTVEHIPGALNIQADWESRNQRDSSEWKLNTQTFQKLYQIWGTPNIDLFASRISHQLRTYFAWKPDPHSKATDAMQQNWRHLYAYAFPPFSLIGRTLQKAHIQGTHMILITPLWQAQSWYPLLLRISVANPILLPQYPNLLKSPEGHSHPLLLNGSLNLTAWKISGNQMLQREFQQQLPSLSQSAENEALETITHMPGLSGKAGVINGKLVQLNAL